ncbi:MAG: rubrerythrin [archaeon]
MGAVKKVKPVQKGLRTEENLWKAFAGESQARNKYEFFASIAKKLGFEQIAAIFQETANNEREHADMIYKLLGERTQGAPTDVDLMAALQKAIEGEHYEWSQMYPEFENVAKEEGQEDAAEFFEQVKAVELQHETRYKKLLDNLKKGKVFKKDTVLKWKCSNCGFIHTAREAPEICPSCFHPRAYFELQCENY